MIEPESLYIAHMEATLAFSGKSLSSWAELSWPEKDYWQFEADVLNEAERGVINEPES